MRSGKRYSFTERDEIAFAYMIGEDYLPSDRKSFNFCLDEELVGLQKVWPYLKKHTDNFLDFLATLVAFINTYKGKNPDKIAVFSAIKGALNDCHIDFEIVKDDDLFGGWQVVIDSFVSDRVLQKITEFNNKARMNASPKKPFKPIEISEEGLELIEYLSLDCTAADGAWHSDSEIKIDKLGYVARNGEKTKEFWDGAIRSEKKPVRLKIRNICGDETMWEI